MGIIIFILFLAILFLDLLRIVSKPNLQRLTSFAINPTLSKLVDKTSTLSLEILSCVGLKPVIPVNAAGILVDPPVSVPIVISDTSRAIDTAPPEVEPPGTEFLKIGFDGVP